MLTERAQPNLLVSLTVSAARTEKMGCNKSDCPKDVPKSAGTDAVVSGTLLRARYKLGAEIGAGAFATLFESVRSEA